MILPSFKNGTAKPPRKPFRLRSGLAALAILILAVGTAGAYSNRECLQCHAPDSGASRRHIDAAAFQNSVHGGQLDCVDCHALVTDRAHTTTPGSGAVDCGSCHDQPNGHGFGAEAGVRPACWQCHTRHAILPSADPRATTNRRNLAATCARCHPGQAGRPDYLSWLPSLRVASHPKEDLGEDYSMDNCLGCHQGKGVHGEEARIAAASCDRCHMLRDGRSALWGRMHPKAVAMQPGVLAAGLIYQGLLVVLLCAGLAFWVHRFSRQRRRTSCGWRR